MKPKADTILDLGLGSSFTPEDIQLISRWSETLGNYGLQAEITHGHRSLGSAFIVRPVGDTEPLWMMHKTPDGACAIRLWPGLAEIVPTIPDGLAFIERAMQAPLVDPGAELRDPIEWLPPTEIEPLEKCTSGAQRLMENVTGPE